MLRRALALGGGLILLILIVLGVKGCLDARANRELSDYARNVTQIVEETQQTSESFFEKLEDPGNLSVTDYVESVNADRSAMDTQSTRIDELDTPGDMDRAQANLELVYQLRANAMDEIADKMRTALADAGVAEKATEGVAKQMQKLLAADVVYEQVVRPEVDNVLASTGISDSDLPESTFLPDEKWLEESTVSDALGAISGGGTNVSGVHGTELTGVLVNGTELVEGAPSTIAGEEGVEVEVQVQNQGESTESGVTVAVTVEGNTLKGEIDELPVGEIGTATIPLTSVPSGEVTLEVEVEAVPGEQVTENNEAAYTLLVE
jgi:CARDB